MYNNHRIRPVSGKQAWKPLFDGKSTSGWHTYGKHGVGEAWKVEDGELCLSMAAKHRDGAAGGDLVTDQAYTHFHLQLEWKISPGGNSGILFFVQDEPKQYEHTWMTGPEVQLLDNAGHADAMIPKRRAGDLYDLISCSQEAAKSAGEWNRTNIVCDHGNLVIQLNGVNVISTTLWDAVWRERIAGSKFRDIPAFGTFRSGHIVLQDHGDEVRFRHIQLQELH